jgi:hypothetical protein
MFAGKFLADPREDCSFQPFYVRAVRIARKVFWFCSGRSGGTGEKILRKKHESRLIKLAPKRPKNGWNPHGCVQFLIRATQNE